MERKIAGLNLVNTSQESDAEKMRVIAEYGVPLLLIGVWVWSFFAKPQD